MKLPKKLLIFGVIALAVRLVLMPITMHFDILAISFSEYFLSFKGVINIYDYLANLPASSLVVLNYGRNFFTYPPLAYFTFGLFGLILKPLFSVSFFSNLAQNLPVIFEQNGLYWHLFLTKLPFLFFDFGALVIILHLFEDQKKKTLAGILWLFNPLSLYTSYMIGQFDIVPVFFTILSLFFAKKGKYMASSLVLGIGGAYKMYPLFFVPFLAILYGKDFVQKIKLMVFGFAPYILTILPFLGSSVFRQTVIFSEQSQKMLYAKIPVSGAEYLSLFVVLYVLLVALSLLKKAELWKWFLLVLALFFSVTHYHPQWFLWITPFLIILWVEPSKLRIFPIIMFICWFLIMIFFEPSLSVSLFSPVIKEVRNVVPLSTTFAKFYDVFQFKSLIRSAFAGVFFFLLVFLPKKDEIA